MKKFFNGKSDANVENAARTDAAHATDRRNEKRRVLLSKNNVKFALSEDKDKNNYSYGESSASDAGVPTGAVAVASNVLAKVQGMNKRIVAVIVVIAMVLSLFAGVEIHFTTKAATKDAAHTITELPYEVTDTDEASHRFKSGDTYFYEHEGRTYTYTFDEDLIEGDQLTFEEDNSIHWTRNAVYGIKNIEDVDNVQKVDSSEDTAPSFTFAQDKTGAGTALLAGERYYYTDSTGKNYVFSFDEDVVKTITSQVRREDTLTDFFTGTFTLNFEADTPSIAVDGNDYQLHTYYVQADTLTDNSVYLITDKSNNRMIGYSDDQNGSVYETSTQPLSKYNLFINTRSPETWDEDEPVLQSNDSVTFSGKQYYDGGYVLSDDNFSQFLFNEFYVSPTTIDRDKYLYLNPVNPQTYAYYSNRVLGHYYSDSNQLSVQLHDLSKRQHGGFLGIGQRDNSEWSVWRYSSGKLESKETSYSNTNYKYLKINENNLVLNTANNGSSISTYLKTNAYSPVDYQPDPVALINISNPVDNGGYFPATSVSYTDSATVAGNDLEIDKTVTEVPGEDGVFDIKLEAYTTAPTLNQPATDIELVLDTSRNMDRILYSREYKNLNTYEGFTEIDLSTGISNDSLFDRDTGNLSDAALELISRIFAGSRDYIHNKYVEDPAAPGTYVYLHQDYELHNLVQNRYTYYFTSSDGTTYQSTTFTQNILGTALDPSTIPETGLRFTALGKDPVVRDKIYTLSNYSGRNTANGSAATNKELYDVSQSTGLYIKDKDGNFRRVFLYKNYRGNGTPQGVVQTGMYRYVIFKNDTEFGEIEYEFSTGGETMLNNNSTRSGAFGVFQGFRSYNEDHELVGDYILSKTLYTKESEDVTALQAMKEALESFLLNAHEQVAEKGAEAYVGLVAYDRDAQIKYKLNSNGSTGSYTDLSLSVGDHSVDEMISDIYNYRVTRQYDRVSREMAYYNVINDSNHNGRRYNGTYAAEVDDGLALAHDELANHNHDKKNSATGENIKSRRYAVLFTAGVPSAYTSFLGIDTSGTFTPSTASNAINTAYNIKNNLDTTFYTVGLFDNANETKINGDYWYYATFGQKVKFNARTSPYWGGSWVANGFSIDPKDAYATNRMLAYISSDYSTPRTLGLTRDSYHPGRSGLWGWLSSGTGYRVDQSFSRDDTGYYLSVSPNTLIETDSTDDDSDYAHATEDVAAILADVFQKLNIATAAPNNTLSAASFMVDGITNYFDLVVDDPSHMPTAQVRDMNDGIDVTKTADLEIIYDDNNTTPAGTTKNIAVTGFPYSTYWVGDGNTNDQRKVVLTFRVKRTDGLIGGNDIPTNLSRTAIYDGDEKSITDATPWGIMEERYEIPRVDLPIQMSRFAQDASIYYGGTQNLEGILDLSDLETIALAGGNGTLIPNEFVTIAYEIKDGHTTVNTYRVPVGATSGEWDHPIQEDANENGTPGTVHEDNLAKIYVHPEESTQYTVNVVVTPVYNGTVRATSFNDNDANVYVFLPHYEVYNGMVENAGDAYDLTAIGKTPLLAEWKYDEAIDLEEGFDPATLLDKNDMPTVTFDLAKYDNEVKTSPAEGKIKDTFETTGGRTSQTAESVDGDLDEYIVNQKTDLIMDNVTLTAKPVEYTVVQKVAEEYYDKTGVIYKSINFDEDGNVISTVYYDETGAPDDSLTGPRAPGTYVDEEGNNQNNELLPDANPIYGSVTKEYVPAALNASVNNKVTFWNDDERTNGAFTISLHAHDVTITNHTVAGQDDTDYSDKTKEFPLTLTLKNGNDPVVNEEITYIDTDGQTRTATTNSNGQIVISMKDADTVTLKDVIDGYKLTVTSNPEDNYHFGYQTAYGDNALGEMQATDPETEITGAIAISDDTRIDLTHSIHEIVVTGRNGIDAHLNPFYIAAAIIALLGGSGTAYAVKRKKETE